MHTLVKPHFPPTTLRSHFSLERALPLPPSTFSSRMVFDLESRSLSSNMEDRLRRSSVANSSNNLGECCYIPKPKGEFNRPSNGYTLEGMCKDTLGWDDDQWSQVELYVDSLVEDHLDRSLPRTQQSADKKSLVHGKVLQKFKFFAQFDRVPGSFETNWLLNDFIARRLKKKDSADANKEKEDSTKKNGSSTVKERCRGGG